MKECIDVLVKYGICFKCCNLVEYFFKNCYEKVVCFVCVSNLYFLVLYIDYGRF